MTNKEKEIDRMSKEIIEEFRQEEVEMLKFKKIKKNIKKYRSKIRCDGKNRLLQIEIGRIRSSISYFVSISKYSDALDLYNDLKIKYNGKNILIPLSIRNSIIAILGGVLAGLFIGELIINLI
jgi:hypothetical protein